MEGNNWRSGNQARGQFETLSLDSQEWKTQLPPNFRQNIVKKIMDTLKSNFPSMGQEGLLELNKISVRFEEKNFNAATSMNDYFQKVSHKMGSMKTKSQKQTIVNSVAPTNPGQNTPNPGSQNMQSEVCNQGQSLSIPVANNKSKKNTTSGGLLGSIMPPGSCSIQNAVQNSNMQGISGIVQNSFGNSMGQRMLPNMLSNPQRQIPGRQQQQIYPQQQVLKPKLQPVNASQSMQSHHQQQLLPTQSQQSLMQPSPAQHPNFPLFVHQENNVSEIHPQQQYQLWLAGQQNKVGNLQQPSMTAQKQIMLQQSNVQKQILQGTSSLFPSQSQSSQKLVPQQPLVMQRQHQGLLQRDMQSRDPTSGLLQTPNVVDRQKQQIFQSQRNPEDSSASLDSTAQKESSSVSDWQEETYQKIKRLGDANLPELFDYYKKLCSKLQMQGTLPPQSKGSQLKTLFEQSISYLHLSRSSITLSHKDKFANVERQVISILNICRSMNSAPPLQQGQGLQSPENHINPQLRNKISGLQHGVAFFSGIQTVPPNTESGLGIAPHQVSVQQNSSLTWMSGMDLVQSSSSMPQNQIPKQPLKQQSIQEQMRHKQMQHSQQPKIASEVQAHRASQLKPDPTFPSSSSQLPLDVSPHISQDPEPNILSNTQTGASIQIPNSIINIDPSPPTSSVPPPAPQDSEKDNAIIHSSNHDNVNIGHQQGISASPLLAEFGSPDGNERDVSITSDKSSSTEQPIERLLRAVKNSSAEALRSSVSDMLSIAGMSDRVGCSPGAGSRRAAAGEDLDPMTMWRLEARDSGFKKMKRCMSAVPLNVTSSAGNLNQCSEDFSGAETSDFDSTSRIKRRRIETISEEIKEVNNRLIDTVVEISSEDLDPNASVAGAAHGTIVKCSFDAVSITSDLKEHYASSTGMSPNQTIRLFVPTNYPTCSPVLLDKTSKGDGDSARAQFTCALRGLSQPLSIKEIARTWDSCARTVVSDYAQQNGGCTFSSRFGAWGACSTAP